MNLKSQNSNMLLAFLTLLGVVAVVAVAGFFALRKGPEIVQGQAEVTEYRVSSKVPGRILEFRVKEGQHVRAGDTLAILEAPDVQAKLEQDIEGIYRILEEGCNVARETAAQTLKEVREAMKINYFSDRELIAEQASRYRNNR